MPTIFTHAIVPLALAAAAGRGFITPRIAFTGALVSMLPDADVIGFKFGIEYADAWGHRGATHSLVFAGLCAGVIALIWKEARSLEGWLFLALSMASHGLLDMLTDGGLGAALWWPFSDARIFASETPIRVSPIGAGFFSMRGLETLLSEVRWIWLPCLALASVGWLARRAARSRIRPQN